jgi:nicotinamidase-related amidase
MATDLRASALIVVDMQNDFLSTGGYYDLKEALLHRRNGVLGSDDLARLATAYERPPETCTIRPGYRALVERVREVAGTALTAGVRTFFVRAAYEPASSVRPPLFLDDSERRDCACHPGSWGGELVAAFEPLAAHDLSTVVLKPTFDGFHATDLCAQLKAKRIKTLYLAGVETNVCVLFTALSALSNGFETTILEDGVATSRRDLHRPALRILEVAKARRMSTQGFLAVLRGADAS